MPEQADVLILCHQGVEDTISCIKSLNNQRQYISNIFVLDNGSDQNLFNLLKKEEQNLKFHLLQSSKNTGFAAGVNMLFNHALLKSSSNYFLVLNNDTIASSNLLKELLEHAHQNYIVSPMILWEHDRSTIIQCAGNFNKEMMKMDNFFQNKSYKDLEGKLHDVEQTDGCCFLIHRYWIENKFLFDEKLFLYFEDVELFQRLNKQGVKFIYNAKTKLYHKEYGSTGGRYQPSAIRNYYFYRNRFYLTKQYHSLLKRWRVYYRLCRLAHQKYKIDQKISKVAANAIFHGIYDFFLNRMGKSKRTGF